MMAGWQTLVIGVLQALAASTAVVLALFIGFSVVFAWPKFRRRPHARVVRSLDERLGGRSPFVAVGIPQGPADQLRTPELLDRATRKS